MFRILSGAFNIVEESYTSEIIKYNGFQEAEAIHGITVGCCCGFHSLPDSPKHIRKGHYGTCRARKTRIKNTSTTCFVLSDLYWNAMCGELDVHELDVHVLLHYARTILVSFAGGT